MGLIEVTYYICDRNSARKQQKIIRLFKRLLRNFESGMERDPTKKTNEVNWLWQMVGV